MNCNNLLGAHHTLPSGVRWRRGVPGDRELRKIVRDSPHIPYRNCFSDDEAAVAYYVSKYCLLDPEKALPAAAGTVEAAGRLYYTAGGIAKIRVLVDESRLLRRGCGRLEPIVFNCAELDENDISRAAEALLEILHDASDLQHVSTPVGAGDTALQLVLNAAGFRMADTILGNHIELGELEILKGIRSTVHPCIRPASKADIPRISSIASECFSERALNVNRFNSDPIFDSRAVGDLYGHWTEAAVLADSGGLVLVYDDGQVQGFMSFALPGRHEIECGLLMGRAILSAVDPGFHKRGVYSNLLLAGSRWLLENGAQFVEGKTQLSNVPVLSVWQRLGGKLKVAYHTYHWSRS